MSELLSPKDVEKAAKLLEVHGEAEKWREVTLSKRTEEIIQLELRAYDNGTGPKLKIPLKYIVRMLDNYQQDLSDRLSALGVDVSKG